MPIASPRQVDASTRWRPLSPGPNSSRRGTPRSSPPLPPRERSSRQAAPPTGLPSRGTPRRGSPSERVPTGSPSRLLVGLEVVIGLGRAPAASGPVPQARPPRARPRSAPSGPGARPRSWSPTGQARARGAFRPSPSRQSRSRSPRRQPPLGGPRPPPRHLPVQIRGPVGRGHPGGHHHPPGPRGERGVDQDQPVHAPCRHRQLALPVPAIGGPGMDALSPRPPLQVHETAAIVPN